MKGLAGGGPQGGEGAGGRQRLIDAALQLASTTRSLASLGLREVARLAGLNPNTFYRHFRNFDELGLAAIEQLGGDLRRGLRERRQRPALRRARTADARDLAELLATGEDVVRESVALVLDFVTEHPAAYVVGIREMYGTSAAMRTALRKLLDEMAADLAADVRLLLPVPNLDERALGEIAQQVIRQMTFFSMDYLEQEHRREEIRREAERFILRMFIGELATRLPSLVPAAVASTSASASSTSAPAAGKPAPRKRGHRAA